MRVRLKKLLRKTAGYLLLALLIALAAGAVWISFLLQPDESAQKSLSDTRRLLRQQGFKTDVIEFDFSTTPEVRAREAVLKAAFSGQDGAQFLDHPNLCEIVGSNSVIVVWRETSLQMQNPSWSDGNAELTWDAFRTGLQTNQATVDTACAAILSGPIRFNLDARGGNAIRLPHLALMKKLEQCLGDQTVVAIHDGDLDAAWTNLLAATRLVTAYEPEPAEISELVRFANIRLVFNTTWQALQTNGWTDDQLARLQMEWETVDFLKDLPETAAFKRASNALICEQERQRSLLDGMTWNEFIMENLRHPEFIWPDINHLAEHLKYVRQGSFEDETNLLLFYRDRELKLKAAIAAPTWQQMCSLPGVTNHVFFQLKNRSRVQTILNLRETGMAFQKGRVGFLARAAEAEARRRILITVLALERYRLQHGAYPPTLDSLMPKYLKSVPLDFMDGQPLRYRLNDDGHFLLYSVGLDCVDDGGIFRTGEQRVRIANDSYLAGITPQADIVWPWPASPDTVRTLRIKESRARDLQNRRDLERESEMDWEISPQRLDRVEKILAAKWNPDSNNPTIQGRPLADAIRNQNDASAAKLSLAELLTPKQVITGGEPEDLTFEVPVSYDVITNLGDLVLLVDAEMDEPMIPDTGGRIQDLSRAPNGNCRLVWHTIFDPPGKHAVQTQLIHTDWRGAEYCGKSPAIAVTTSNLCQFSLDSSTYDAELGATFHARLPEKNGSYVIECVTTNGTHLATLTGSTTNGEFKTVWNLVDDHGHRLTGETFNSIVHITLPNSGRTQTLRGP